MTVKRIRKRSVREKIMRMAEWRNHEELTVNRLADRLRETPERIRANMQNMVENRKLELLRIERIGRRNIAVYARPKPARLLRVLWDRNTATKIGLSNG